MSLHHVGELQERLIRLAGTPDDDSGVREHLTVITKLVADRVAAVDYASVTSRIDGEYTTVAVSSDLVAAVDQAQYADAAGPCLEALDAGYPAAVPDIGATMTWRGFRDVASRIGLRASLSVPLSAGSGRVVAALNLYGRDPVTMATLTAAVWAAFDPAASSPWVNGELDSGGRELAGGLIGALALRNMIQQALGVIMSSSACTADCAYRALLAEAADTGRALPDAAQRLIERQRS